MCATFLIKLIRFQTQKKTDSLDDETTSEEEVSRDLVTNLPLMQRGVAALSAFIKAKGADNVAVIAFKPVNFEQMNNVLGHKNADLLLLQFAYKMQLGLSDNKLLLNLGTASKPIKLCRLQGLDFAVFVDKSVFEHPENFIIDDLCQTLIKTVPQAISVKNCSLNFDLVLGVSTGSAQHHANQLITEACDALIQAERLGQTKCYYEQRHVLHGEMRLAHMEKLRNYQQTGKLESLVLPQVSCSKDTVVGFEMALDWQTYFGNAMSKEEFEEMAAFSNVIYPLTKMLIKDAFSVLKIANSQKLSATVSVNLNSSVLLEAELADYIETQAEQHGVAINQLIIELNEKVLLSSAFRARMMIDQLKALGIKIAVDEFSGSYEALKYLRRAAVHQVKIDCSHIDDTAGYRVDKTIVNALINLIRKMDIMVVGTGMDRLSIKENYEAIGGDVAQGKLVHRGLKKEQVLDWCISRQSQASKVS